MRSVYVYRGISPVIATVILVAIALVLAIALAGWVMGIWGTLGATEALQISGVIANESNVLNVNVTVINKGNAVANITRVEFVDDIGSLRVNSSVNLIVQPGQSVSTNITVNVPGVQVSVGRTYVVRFYTAAGNVYDVPMRCVKKGQ